MELMIRMLNNLKSNIKQFRDYTWARARYHEKVDVSAKNLILSEAFQDDKIDPIIDFYESWIVCNTEAERLDCIDKSVVLEYLTDKIIEYSKREYSNIRIDYETYKTKIMMYYTDNYEDKIVYLATSHYTDQEYRTFLANLQKGKKRINFSPVNPEDMSHYSLVAIKDGYVSRVKRATNSNSQDGYHADFTYDSNRFFLLKDGDNPIDSVYSWIEEHTQAAVLPEWKTYIYNSLIEKAMIHECTVINYTSFNLKGIVLSEEVTTDTIREIRKEGLELREIEIPTPAISLDDDMSFIDVMNEYIIPEINQRDSLYTVGDEISKSISSPIIMKQGNKYKKTYLYPKQQVMAQGMLNGIKAGRRNLVLNGGMGVGKTYTSIKLSSAIIKEIFHKGSGRVSIFAQSHLIPKWQRQFSEALPDENIKFFQLNSYKDVMDLPGGDPDGIEVYLLPKDKVKRKYLEYHAANRRTSESVAYRKMTSHLMGSTENKYIYVANEIKASEMKLLARNISKRFDTWGVVAKEVLADDGSIRAYRVATTSSILKKKFGDGKGYYNFEIDTLDKIWNMKEELDNEVFDHIIYDPFQKITRGLVCPTCGGPLYDSPHFQISEDEYDTNLFSNPGTKADKNKKCSNYIKIDGTPLTQKERKMLIKGELGFIVGEEYDSPYLIDGLPVDGDTLKEIKSGSYDGSYVIALKKCGTSLWAPKDQKGYRTVNAIDMLQKRFGKDFFMCSIADEAHLYAAESMQGLAFSKLCNMSRVNIALTGTLTGGKASHLFHMLYRMIPHKMSRHFKYNEVTKFIDYYGRRKKVTKEYGKDSTYNKSGVGKKSTSYSEIPGISPMLYSHFLADIMVSRKIEDMGFDLPPLLYFKHTVEMDKDIRNGYEKLKEDIITFMKEHKELNLGGTYLNALLSYPDMPITEPLVYDGMLISNPPQIDISDRILPKEKKLIDTLKKELSLGRRMVVYVTYTGEKAVDKRLEEVLTKQGFKVALLKSSVPTEKREEWIEKKYKEGYSVILTNAKLVQTGLDIIGFPTMYFYELDYDVRVVRQAESRAWRVGQKKDCYVYYSYYQDSLAEDALRLIGSKKKASLAVEGVFAEDILSASGDDVVDSGATALYKSLLGKIKLKEDDLDFFSEEEFIEIDEYKVMPEENVAMTVEKEETGQINLFTITSEKIKKKEKRKMVVGQVSLFEC